MLLHQFLCLDHIIAEPKVSINVGARGDFKVTAQ
jgi:hypothetical protein